MSPVCVAEIDAAMNNAAHFLHGSDLKAVLHTTVHRGPLSAKQIAWCLRISESYLTRACLDGASGVRFPLDLLLPLMHLTNNFNALDFLAARSGRVAVEVRASAFRRNRAARLEQISEQVHRALALACTLLLDQRGGELTSREVDSALYHAQAGLGAIRNALKANLQQGELF